MSYSPLCIAEKVMLHWSVWSITSLRSSSRGYKRFGWVSRVYIISILSIKRLSLPLLTTRIRISLVEGALSCQVDIAMVRDRTSVT